MINDEAQKEVDAIGAGGVSGQPITSQRRGAPVELTLGQKAVAAELLEHFKAWEPMICVLGNVRARDGADLMQAVLSASPQPVDETTARVGAWLSAALDDPAVCQEMKDDIRAWFKVGQPNVQPAEPGYKQLYEQMCERCDYLDAKLAEYSEREPVAWESTTPAYRKYVTDSTYQRFSDKSKRWYKPYRCASCDGAQTAAPKFGEEE